jgi:6-phosphofructokinase
LIKKEFKSTFTTKQVEFEPSKEKENSKKQKVGIFFSGGPAAGGHNVITGLFDYLKSQNEENQLIGFLMGPIGLKTTLTHTHRLNEKELRYIE